MDATTFKPRMPLGRLDRDLLERLARVVREYDIPVVRATAGQRLLLAGIKPKDWDAVAQALGGPEAACPHSVQACPGQPACSYGLEDSLGLGAELEKMLAGMDLPAKVKAGVSLNQFMQMHVDLASKTHVEIKDGKYSIMHFNDIKHLKGLSGV